MNEKRKLPWLMHSGAWVWFPESWTKCTSFLCYYNLSPPPSNIIGLISRFSNDELWFGLCDAAKWWNVELNFPSYTRAIAWGEGKLAFDQQSDLCVRNLHTNNEINCSAQFLVDDSIFFSPLPFFSLIHLVPFRFLNESKRTDSYCPDIFTIDFRFCHFSNSLETKPNHPIQTSLLNLFSLSFFFFYIFHFPSMAWLSCWAGFCWLSWDVCFNHIKFNSIVSKRMAKWWIVIIVSVWKW